jgi:hypothetical protein
MQLEALLFLHAVLLCLYRNAFDSSRLVARYDTIKKGWMRKVSNIYREHTETMSRR